MLQIKNLSKFYGGATPAVDNLSLHVERGDIFGFIGHNGAGKTTTLRCVAGILNFSDGEILIDGKSIKADPLACKQLLSYIPDNPDLYDHLTGIRYINFLADVYGVSDELRNERITRYAAEFEITSHLGDLIGSLSHGMKQKIAIIGALIHEPKLLLLDEPFVGLDPKAAHSLKTIMHQMVENGSAIFFSTHVLEVAEKLCNKVAIIKNGQLVVTGDMDTVRGDSSLEELFLELTDK